VHTAALAEHKGNLSLKLRALHELSRSLWLEARLGRESSLQAAVDVTGWVSPEEDRNTEEARRLTQESRESEEGESDLDRAIRLSRGPTLQPRNGE
jgi:hypothetical protein